MRVRYEGPEQGIALLRHSLGQFGVTVTSMTPPALQRAAEQVVCVELEVAGAPDRWRLASDVRTALGAFAALYHRAGLDLIEP